MPRFLLFSFVGLFFSFWVQAQSSAPTSTENPGADTPSKSASQDSPKDVQTDKHADKNQKQKVDTPSSAEDLDDYFSKAEDEAILGSMCEPPKDPTV